MKQIKVALVHDYLNQTGGAEKVVWELHQIYKDAPLYTSIYDKVKMPSQFSEIKVVTSFMQKLPFIFKLFKWYFLLYPFAFRRFDLSGFDVILSSSTAYAKGIKKPKGTVHICDCNTPARFLWMFEHYMQNEKLPYLAKIIIKLLTLPLRYWDLKTSAEVDCFIANSKNVADRIKKIYQRDSVIIYPPVDTSRYQPVEQIGNYYLIVSRLNSYKRIDLAVKAFNKLGYPLIVIGEGPDRKNLEKIAKPNIKFLGRLSDRETQNYFARCQALIFPGEEDFGLTPVEAMSCGRPVVAFAKGGALETVVDGKTGVLFNQQTDDALMIAVNKLKNIPFDPKQIREQAKRFDIVSFRAQIKKLVTKIYQEKVAQA